MCKNNSYLFLNVRHLYQIAPSNIFSPHCAKQRWKTILRVRTPKKSCLYLFMSIFITPPPASDRAALKLRRLARNVDSYILQSLSWGLTSRKLQWNGILLPKLFWPTVRKKCSSDRENFLKFEAEGWEISKCLRSPEKFI